MRTPYFFLGLTALLIASSPAFAQDRAVFISPRPLPPDITPRVPLGQCGAWRGFYGPIDYRTTDAGTRARVESHHFDDYIPRFLTWQTTQPFDKYIAANFSYTLRAFPNHPVSLSAMEQIGRRLKSEFIPGSMFPMECWYVRAFQTTPDDPVVHAQYGIYLAFRGRAAEARAHLDSADDKLCTSAAMQYQIGMANINLGAWEKAQRNALRIDRLNAPLPAVKQALVNAGKWNASTDTLPLEKDAACQRAISGDEDPANAPASASASSPPAPK